MTIPDFVRRPGKRLVLAAMIGGAALLAVVQLARIGADPDFVYLNDRGGAYWIYHEYVNFTHTVAADTLATAYFTRFSVSRPPDSAVLEVQGLKSFRVRLNGQTVRDFHDDDPETWKETTEIDLKPFLKPGNHRLEITVVNESGPTAAWARCPELDIYTDEHWEAYLGSGTMGEVERCRDPQTVPISYEFGPAWYHFLWALPLLLPVFAAGLYVAFKVPRERLDEWLNERTARMVAFGLAGALLLLGLNNMFRLDHRFGYDVQGHYEYIDWVADKWTLPLAPDGWQMFQSPLYYVLSAPIYALSASADDPVDFAEAAETGTFHFYPVRIVSILCGALHPLVAYALAVLVWPGRPRLQIFATLFGGLLPVNIYMSQFVGNENLMGILGAAVLLLGACVLKRDGPPSMRLSIACGVALGLALLAKATALLLIPVCLAAFASRFWGRPGALPDFLKKAGTVAAIVFLISGWYYIRNWVHLGEPFVGGWETREGMEWWQAPGYRMWTHYARFGMALAFPIYSGFVGLWDCIYSTLWLDGLLGSSISLQHRPDWIDSLLGASAWVAILPTAALLLGAMVPAVRMLRRADADWSFEDRLQVFALATVGLYLAAIVYMHLTVPIWIWGKASYMTATTPLLAFLAARGYALLRNRGRLFGAIVFAWFACWFFTAYAAYIVLAPFESTS